MPFFKVNIGMSVLVLYYVWCLCSCFIGVSLVIISSSIILIKKKHYFLDLRLNQTLCLCDWFTGDIIDVVVQKGV
jgi:hypothetical protein